LAVFAYEQWLSRVDPGRKRWFELHHALSLEGEVVKRYFPQWAKIN
jgi:hypothetical protein